MILALLVYSCLPSISIGQDFSQTVVPITALRVKPATKVSMSAKLGPAVEMNAEFGTGFCLDPLCGFIVTNYHVAVAAPVKKIERQKVYRRYFDSGADDEDATANYVPGVGAVAFATKRDLAIYELDRYPPHHHGIGLSLDELRVGQEVDIYGYPKALINPIRRLVQIPATFKGPTTSGLIAFDYESADKPVRLGGASGGIVVDRKTAKIVGVLCGVYETTALAVPVATLRDFVMKIDPFLAKKIFPTSKEISPVSQDLYPKFVPPRSGDLEHRIEESSNIRRVRENATALAESIRNLIAVQNMAWGSDDRQPEALAAYEIRVVDGFQTFRSYPDGKTELKEVPLPRLRGWALPADEWSQLPKMVGTEYRLKIREAPDAVVNERRLKVFQYYASVEDNLCPFEPVEDFGLFTVGKVVAVACYGEVWTDDDMNILRMSERLDLSKRLGAYRGWQNYGAVLTYGWLNWAKEPPRLIPLTFLAEASDKKHVYWCRGHFSDYRAFSSKSKVAVNGPAI